MDAVDYRTSSTPVLVCVSFSPRLAPGCKFCPGGQFASAARGGAIIASPFQGLVGIACRRVDGQCVVVWFSSPFQGLVGITC